MNREEEDHSGCERVVLEIERQFHETAAREAELEAQLREAFEELREANANIGDLGQRLQAALDAVDDAAELAECYRNDYRQADADHREAEARNLELEALVRDGQELLATSRSLTDSLMGQLEIESDCWVQLMRLAAEVRLPRFGKPKLTLDVVYRLLNDRDKLKGAFDWGSQP